MRFRQLKTHLALVPAGILILGSFVTGCSAGGEMQSVEDDRIPVLVDTVVRSDLRVVRPYTGGVEGIRQATVYARLPETIVGVHVSEGDRVQAGDRLVSFDESGPGSALRQSRALWEDAKKTAAKFERLFREGAVSEIERDARQTAYQVAAANYEAARDRAVLTAPISGIVTEVYARSGRQANVGAPMVQVAAVDTIRVLLDVSVYESGTLRKGLPVLVRSELDTAITAQGWVAEISAAADARTRTLSVEIFAVNPERRLLPGMFVRAEIELDAREQAIVIPREALVFREFGLGTFVVRDSVARFAAVDIGAEAGGRVEILSGLDVGDQVVVLGQSNLQDGTRINPVQDNADGESVP